MGRYLELLKENRRKRAQDIEAGQSTSASNAETRDPSAMSGANPCALETSLAWKVTRRGWQSKVRSGKAIWQNPANGSYFSQEDITQIVEAEA